MHVSTCAHRLALAVALLAGAALVRPCFVLVLLADGIFLFVLANSVQLAWPCVMIDGAWVGNVWCV
jgi:hypothetical protein